MTNRAPRVSVVVPVFEPGPYIEPAIRSILGQTMPAGSVEAIFIDDGSTDDTPDRLDRLATEHPATIRVIHIPPSGAPGRPRNIGLEAARGDYVQFLDADDELALDAFEQLVPIGDRNRSDVVVEKFASASIPRSQRLFDRSIEQTTLADLPALVDSSLGPAKLYRRTFLIENGIRFQEGWRQMEDQEFAIHAYARARTISVAADRPWYFYNRRDDDGHLTSERIDPERHFRNLRTVLDLVEAETEPGAVRDRMVRRMLRVEVLNRVSEPVYQLLPDDERGRLFAGARDVVRERISAAVVEGLGAVRRQRCELLRDDRADDLLAMARQLGDVVMSATLGRADWNAGVLDLTVTGGLVFESNGAPLGFDDGRSHRDPADPRDLAGHPYTVTGDAGMTRIQVVLRSKPSVLDWYIKAPGEPFSDRVGGIAHARIDPMRVGAGARPIDAGRWDLLLRLSGLGIERSAALTSDPAATTETPRPALLGSPARVVVPTIDHQGIHLAVDPPPAVLATALTGRSIRVVHDGDRLVLDLPMVSGPGVSAIAIALIVTLPDGDQTLPAHLVPRRGGVVLESTLDGLSEVVAGRYPVHLRLGGDEDRVDVFLGSAAVGRGGALRFDGLERLSTLARIEAVTQWLGTRGASTMGRVGRRIRRRLMR